MDQSSSRRHYLDMMNLPSLDVKEDIRRISERVDDVYICFYDTHRHTADFLGGILDEMGIAYKRLAVKTTDPVHGGQVTLDGAGADPAGRFACLCPYDPHGEISRFVATSLSPLHLADYTIQFIFPGHMALATIKDHLDEIVEVDDLLADDESRRCFRQLIQTRWTGDRATLPFSNFECYFHAGVRATQIDRIADCGAFEGHVARAFSNALAPKASIVCFEPDRTNFAALRKRREEPGVFRDRIEIVNAGIWSKATKARVVGVGHAARLDFVEGQADDANDIRLLSLDDFYADRPEPNFIKMDIEGSEVEAIRGAQRILARTQPALAISLYHKPEDLWQIPIEINRLNPSYKTYVGHHSKLLYESVVYCCA